MCLYYELVLFLSVCVCVVVWLFSGGFVCVGFLFVSLFVVIDALADTQTDEYKHISCCFFFSFFFLFQYDFIP